MHIFLHSLYLPNGDTQIRGNTIYRGSLFHTLLHVLYKKIVNSTVWCVQSYNTLLCDSRCSIVYENSVLLRFLVGTYSIGSYLIWFKIFDRNFLCFCVKYCRLKLCNILNFRQYLPSEFVCWKKKINRFIFIKKYLVNNNLTLFTCTDYSCVRYVPTF